LEQAEEGWGNEDGRHKKKLEEDLERLRGLLEELCRRRVRSASGGCGGSTYLWAQTEPEERASEEGLWRPRDEDARLGAVEQVAKAGAIPKGRPESRIRMAPTTTPASAL